MFEFLASLRWGDDGVAGPGIGSAFHMVWFAVMILMCIVAVKIAGKKPDAKRDDRVILILDGILIFTEILKQLMYDVGYYHYLRIDIIPFSFCSVPLFTAFIGALTKNGKAKDVCYKFLAFYGLVGGLCTMIYPASLETSFVFSSFHTMLWHSLMAVIAVYLIAAKGYGKSFLKEMVPPTVLFVALTLLAVSANEAVFFGYLKPMQTPTYTAEYMPGAYEYYKHGYFDYAAGDYRLLSDSETPMWADDFRDAANTVITYADESGSAYYLTYEDRFGAETYISLSDTENGVVPVWSHNVPETAWDFDYSGTHPALVTHFDDGDYCLDFQNGEIGASRYLFTEGQVEGSFIKVKTEREDDSANFFFVSNHCETPIPVLNLVQAAAPYPVFVLVYVVSVFGVSTLFWLALYGIRKMTVPKKSEE